MDEDADSYNIHPIFVAVTPSMALTDHDGRSAAQRGTAGGEECQP
jgi:hypothetical protein